MRADGKRLPQADMAGAIVLPQGHLGPAFLVYDNFAAILHWTRSITYAIAVGYLADRLIGLPRLRTGLEADNRPLAHSDTLELQYRLNEVGFDSGTPDGIPGPATREAVRRFQTSIGLPADGYPSVSLLEKMRRPARSD